MKLFSSVRLAKIAATASVISLMGAQTGFAGQTNQSANVFANSKTKVTATQIVLTGNATGITQIGGKNQNAYVPSSAVSVVSSSINASSGNTVVIIQK